MLHWYPSSSHLVLLEYHDESISNRSAQPLYIFRGYVEVLHPKRLDFPYFRNALATPYALFNVVIPRMPLHSSFPCCLMKQFCKGWWLRGSLYGGGHSIKKRVLKGYWILSVPDVGTQQISFIGVGPKHPLVSAPLCHWEGLVTCYISKPVKPSIFNNWHK